MRPGHAFRRLARDLLPPALATNVALAVHRWRQDATYFEGDFDSWAAARAAGTGYESEEILERTLAATLTAQRDPTAFERDSVLLPRPEYSFPVIAALLWIAQRHGGRLRVVDFGGALGSSFFQFRPFLAPLRELSWAVVEQPHIAAAGAREIHEPGLSFHTSIASAMGEGGADVLFLSSVLQYLPSPHEQLRAMLGEGDAAFKFVLLDRTAFHCDNRDRLTIQRNPASVHAASYPAWFLEEEQLHRAFRDYRLVFEFEGRDRALLAGGRAYYRGFFFSR